MHVFLKEIYETVINKRHFNCIEILDFVINNYERFDPNWHALGFIHCKLISFDKGTLRLHIWDGQEKHHEEQREKIHDHLFSLNSFLISGGIKNEFFEALEVSNNTFTHYAYIIKYGDAFSQLKLIDKVYKVRKLEERIISGGEYYVIDSTRFHRSGLISGDSALTLVATYDHLKKDPVTLSKVQLEDNKHRHFQPYDKQKWRDKLLLIRKSL
ncbi:hypothetical protein BW31_04404 [Pantoea agglomerans]|uniref:hypothetical protein n=1 Tax=Enterobacter agglomerans TaxID=549 RepID=UPI00044AFA85|nr:hypothetical protein [Pantoea agglomerans]EZI30653.1 hypothetical protein BW31_04404 [Pantoea agglomerans]